jgi:hypothetical protein
MSANGAKNAKSRNSAVMPKADVVGSTSFPVRMTTKRPPRAHCRRTCCRWGCSKADLARSGQGWSGGPSRRLQVSPRIADRSAAPAPISEHARTRGSAQTRIYLSDCLLATLEVNLDFCGSARQDHDFSTTTISLRRTPMAAASSFRRSPTTSLSGARAAAPTSRRMHSDSMRRRALASTAGTPPEKR